MFKEIFYLLLHSRAICGMDILCFWIMVDYNNGMAQCISLCQNVTEGIQVSFNELTNIRTGQIRFVLRLDKMSKVCMCTQGSQVLVPSRMITISILFQHVNVTHKRLFPVIRDLDHIISVAKVYRIRPRKLGLQTETNNG